ncbi:hypothetical protein ACEWK1_14130 [Metabacillus sp. YM-086]
MSRYKWNRDPKAAKQLRYVPIQAKSGHKSSNQAKICPDTSGIGTQEQQSSKDMSRYKRNRDPKAANKQKAVPIQAQPGQLSVFKKIIPLQ